MAASLRLLGIFAHPDDETLGTGGTLARYASEGVETYLVTATRGERGWFGPPEEDPGLTALGQMRERELAAAARVLGVKEHWLLDAIVGELDQAPAPAITARLVDIIRTVRPDVVLTFDPFGVYGHPDHIAICQLATGAVFAAADPAYQDGAERAPHSVSKLYTSGSAGRRCWPCPPWTTSPRTRTTTGSRWAYGTPTSGARPSSVPSATGVGGSARSGGGAGYAGAGGWAGFQAA